MHYVISADDLGASVGVTDHILDAADRGLLTSVSVLANGTAAEYALEETRRRRELRVSLHLNFVEGRPIAPVAEVPLLVDGDGVFRLGFLSLWAVSLRTRGAQRVQWKWELKTEIRAQIERVRDVLGADWAVCVDSHLHLHMIPLVFEALLELQHEYEFRYMRVLEEPLFFAAPDVQALRNYLGPNLLKHFLLNGLSRAAKPQLRARGIPHCDYFVGVLFTGNMRTSVARAALASAARRSDRGVIELLFHPGRAEASEEQTWPERLLAFREQYRSPWRDRERETLKEPGFRALFDSLERYVDPAAEERTRFSSPSEKR